MRITFRYPILAVLGFALGLLGLGCRPVLTIVYDISGVSNPTVTADPSARIASFRGAGKWSVTVTVSAPPPPGNPHGGPPPVQRSFEPSRGAVEVRLDELITDPAELLDGSYVVSFVLPGLRTAQVLPNATIILDRAAPRFEWQPNGGAEGWRQLSDGAEIGVDGPSARLRAVDGHLAEVTQGAKRIEPRPDGSFDVDVPAKGSPSIELAALDGAGNRGSLHVALHRVEGKEAEKLSEVTLLTMQVVAPSEPSARSLEPGAGYAGQAATAPGPAPLPKPAAEPTPNPPPERTAKPLPAAAAAAAASAALTPAMHAHKAPDPEVKTTARSAVPAEPAIPLPVRSLAAPEPTPPAPEPTSVDASKESPLPAEKQAGPSKPEAKGEPEDRLPAGEELTIYEEGGVKQLVVRDFEGHVTRWLLPSEVVGIEKSAEDGHALRVSTETEKDVTMQLVPGGPLPDAGSGTPAQRVPPFLMDRREVTVERFARSKGEASRSWMRELGAEFRGNQQPVVVVSWQEAVDFAHWARKDLPREAEWLVAAGWDGSHYRAYPWGDDFNAGHIGRSWVSAPPETAGASQDISPCGVVDLAASVREWLLDEVPGKSGYRSVRGGSVVDPRSVTPAPPPGPEQFLLRQREAALTLVRRMDVGFRCVIRLRPAPPREEAPAPAPSSAASSGTAPTQVTQPDAEEGSAQ